jgi:peptide/nickel transport system substrate-binding protein
MTSQINRRELIKSITATAAAGTPLSSLLWSPSARAAIGDTLTIAYSVAPPTWDPNSGPSAVNPGLQSLFRSLYDAYMIHRPDLTLAPGIADEYGWNADKTSLSLRIRKGATWHDGAPVTPSDIAWNMKRLADPAAGNPQHAVFTPIKNVRVDGDRVSCDVLPFRATMLERLSFVASFLIPPHHYERVGKEGFEKNPIGSGPYMFQQYEAGSFVRFKANPNYWGGKPVFEHVVFKFVTDPSSRVSEIERGSSDLTLDIPYEEFERLKKRPGLTGVAGPVTDIAMLFLNNVGIMADANVRKAAAAAIDKKTIVERLHRGYGTAIDTLLAPQYKSYDASLRTPYDPKRAEQLLAASGYSKDKPVEFTIQTTRGLKPKDYETVQAVVEMWRRVGIKANIEVYEVAKHFDLRIQHKLAPAAFYNWGNATADPESSLGTAMYGKSASSSWKTQDVDEKIVPLLQEKDTAKRLEGYRKVNGYITENVYVIPLFQYHQPVVHKKELEFRPHLAGYVLPFLMGRRA